MIAYGRVHLVMNRFWIEIFRPYFIKKFRNTQSIAEFLLFCLNEKSLTQNCKALQKALFWMKNKAKDLHNPDGYGGLLTKLYAKIMLFERIIPK